MSGSDSSQSSDNSVLLSCYVNKMDQESYDGLEKNAETEMNVLEL